MGMHSQASCFCGGGTGLEFAGPLLLEAELDDNKVREKKAERLRCLPRPEGGRRASQDIGPRPDGPPPSPASPPSAQQEMTGDLYWL